MRFIEKPVGKFIDKKSSNNNLENIDVLMLTLDAELSIEKSLFSIYKEIPVNRLIVCGGGGSKDHTIQILKKIPRTKIFVRLDIRTTGKGLNFIFLIGFYLIHRAILSNVDSNLIITMDFIKNKLILVV